MRQPEAIYWNDVDTELPDSDLIVLCKLADADPHGEPVWPGFMEEGEWMAPDRSPFGSTVTHWAEMPKGPVK